MRLSANPAKKPVQTSVGSSPTGAGAHFAASYLEILLSDPMIFFHRCFSCPNWVNVARFQTLSKTFPKSRYIKLYLHFDAMKPPQIKNWAFCDSNEPSLIKIGQVLCILWPIHKWANLVWSDFSAVGPAYRPGMISAAFNLLFALFCVASNLPHFPLTNAVERGFSLTGNTAER